MCCHVHPHLIISLVPLLLQHDWSVTCVHRFYTIFSTNIFQPLNLSHHRRWLWINGVAKSDATVNYEALTIIVGALWTRSLLCSWSLVHVWLDRLYDPSLSSPCAPLRQMCTSRDNILQTLGTHVQAVHRLETPQPHPPEALTAYQMPSHRQE